MTTATNWYEVADHAILLVFLFGMIVLLFKHGR